ncbi:hypothetical protein CK221_22025 [Mesorhizobium sp. WSM3868]|nr:hypothetical protein CK221_22025 [Mesorhizobium sp. WSM3868]
MDNPDAPQVSAAPALRRSILLQKRRRKTSQQTLAATFEPGKVVASARKWQAVFASPGRLDGLP